jgi:Glu-tRNA(Gln) amidotransferase subunit E-like FAD-binding protein
MSQSLERMYRSSYHEIRDLIQKEGPAYRLKDWSDVTGLASSTCSNIINGRTKRPQYRTILLMLRGSGIDIEFVKEQQTKLKKKVRHGRPNLKLRKAS